MNIKDEVFKVVSKAKEASRLLGVADTAVKNGALAGMAAAIRKNAARIKEANKLDLARSEEEGLSVALIDRLTLTDARIESMAVGLEDVVKLPDPVGELIEEVKRPNGLLIRKVRVAMGVIGIIYESRPNVTCDSAGLCLKSGNAVVLRGGSESINSNKVLAAIIQEAACGAGLPDGAIGLIQTTDREAVTEMAQLDGYIDMIILRGGERMISNISKNATVPVMRHGKGLCHTYVDEAADPAKAENICFNAKVQRPGVCNAMETLLVHSGIADKFLPGMAQKFTGAGVELRGDEKARAIVAMKPTVEADWAEEYLSLVLSIKVVNSLEEAVEHIARYSSGHSDAIVTEDEKRAEEFMKLVDSASVYWNASTRFTDGGQFGLGAEIGISTQKSHARGPMGIRDLTSIKYRVYGKGQVRE